MITPAGKRFLIVDDNPVIAEILSATLRYALNIPDVDLAQNAEDALVRLNTTHYDILVADHRMPGTQGTTLIREARRIDPKLHVILITANADTFLRKEISELGDIGLITKPFEVDDILRALPLEPLNL